METYFISCLILLTSFVEVLSETKEVFRGETVLLFANVSADSPDNEVHLYINGKKDNTLLASWKFEKAGFKTVSKTYHNIVMDVDRNILIYNVNENFTGKYSLHDSSRPAIELIVHGNSQINWENPSQNILLWIVGISLAFALPASAFFLFVAYRKWGKKIRPCHKCRHGKHQTPKEPGEDIELVRSENPQYEEEIKKALCPLLEMMKNQDVVIQELAKKAKVEEQRVKEEEEKYSKMRKRIADLDANVETVKDQLAKVEMQRVKEEDMKYSHMMKTMADSFAKLGMLNTMTERYQNCFNEDGGMLHSSGNLGNDYQSFELQARTRVNEKDSEIERRRNNIKYVESSLILSHSNLINGTMDKMMPGSPLIATKTPTSENR